MTDREIAERLETLARALRRCEPCSAVKALRAEIDATIAHGRALPADVEALETAAADFVRGRGV